MADKADVSAHSGLVRPPGRAVVWLGPAGGRGEAAGARRVW